MTIEATPRHHRFRQDGILIKTMDIALVDADVTTDLIAGLDATIGQTPVIKSVLADEDCKVLILLPLTLFLYTDRYREFTTLVLFRQLMPVIDSEIRIVALSMQFATLRAFDDNIHAVDLLVSKVKVQRCDIGRDCHTDIVGIDFWQLPCLHRIHRSLRASHEEQTINDKP